MHEPGPDNTSNHPPAGGQPLHGHQLAEVNHEAALGDVDRLLGGYAGEDPVCQSHHCLGCWDKGAHMGQEDDEGNLLGIAALAAPVGACYKL